MKRIIISLSLVFSISLFLISCSQENKKSAVKKNEKFYQVQMCNRLKGEIEVVLHDKTRVDCLTDKYAIEVDWARKWAEGVGQSIYYAEMTNKKPAIALIMADTDADERHYKRLSIVAIKLNIHIIRLDK
jgi:hypothetical protein